MWDAREGASELSGRGGGLPCDLTDGGSAPRADRIWGVPRRTAVLMGVLAVIAAVVLTAAPSVDGGVVRRAAQGAQELTEAASGAAASARERAQQVSALSDRVVCVDAGHGGGYDLTLTPIGPGSYETQYVEPGGTSGVATGVEEATVTLQVALLLQAKLEEQGVTVVMVRTDDSRAISSEERAGVANSCGADLFVRLHCDGSEDSSRTGFSTLVPGYNEWTGDIVEASAQAASIMHPIILEETGANDAGIVERTDLAGFNFCEVPCVLFEMGFMSNYDEDLMLNDPAYQDVLATAICDATVAYLESLGD